jgi:8-oxo-dGTP diphosphatase
MRQLQDVDWDHWLPAVHATLLFVVRDGRILLIRKKRGLGAGKINGPGGKLDSGEAPRVAAVRETEEELCITAAVRETEEELCITPTGVEQCGELSFQFTDGLSILGYVFLASGCEGRPQETEEAAPLWTPVDAIPYHEMWADDEIWMPWLLEGKKFAGRMLFEGDELLGHAFEIRPPEFRFEV